MIANIVEIQKDEIDNQISIIQINSHIITREQILKMLDMVICMPAIKVLVTLLSIQNLRTQCIKIFPRNTIKSENEIC